MFHAFVSLFLKVEEQGRGVKVNVAAHLGSKLSYYNLQFRTLAISPQGLTLRGF